jgi:hypothetical protein
MIVRISSAHVGFAHFSCARRAAAISARRRSERGGAARARGGRAGARAGEGACLVQADDLALAGGLRRHLCVCARGVSRAGREGRAGRGAGRASTSAASPTAWPGRPCGFLAASFSSNLAPVILSDGSACPRRAVAARAARGAGRGRRRGRWRGADLAHDAGGYRARGDASGRSSGLQWGAADRAAQCGSREKGAAAREVSGPCLERQLRSPRHTGAHRCAPCRGVGPVRYALHCSAR